MHGKYVSVDSEEYVQIYLVLTFYRTEMETRAGQFVRDLGDRDRGLEELHTTVSSLCKTIEVLLTKSAPLISSSKISNRERRNKTGNDMDDQQLVKHTTVGRPIGGETDGTRQHYDDDRGQRCSAVRSQRCNDVRSQPCNDDRSQPCNDDRGKEPARNTQRRSRSRSEKASGLPLVTTGSHRYKRRVTPDASDNRLTPRRTRAGQLSTPGLVVTGEHQVNVAKTTVAVASRTDVRTDTQ